MKKILPAWLAALSLLLAACANVDEADRYITITPAEVNRAVLVEEFTGQACVNCPEAHEELARIQEEYGSDKVIAVGIHASPLAVFPRGTTIGLRTQLGDDYYNHWQGEAVPAAVIDRTSGMTNVADWRGIISRQLSQKTPLELSMNNRYDKESRQLSIHIEALSAADVTGKLQVWITEDSIVCTQLMKDGKANKAYVQNHVLRAAVNGAWGTDLTLRQATAQQLTFDYKLDAAWIPENVYVVAFVYNDDGVLQVIKGSTHGVWMD